MHSFHVIDNGGQGHSVAMRDGAGRYHVARATADVPDIGADLEGAYPSAGFGLLLGARSGQVFRMTFAAVDCSLHDSLALLYP